MMPNEQPFNLSEYAKQIRKEINELERKYKEKKGGGETDADPETDREPAVPVRDVDG